MPTRLIIAYSLIGLMIAAAAAVVWWNAHHSRTRTLARRARRGRARPKRNKAGDAANEGIELG